MLQIIIMAILKREYLEFTYDGCKRIIQPVAVGASRADYYVLRGYQTEGDYIEPGREWELFDLSKISDLRATKQYFAGEPPQYCRGDKRMIEVYAEL
ncbi:MAG TPA: hypothetical protein PK893_13715 [Candidatus Competibacteraceae bacterium]|nr:hypothetical protein [Candidatus Competibacteraceae bacterium]HQD57596.1 hypothetical protein [Candidatus Competibacteraceae bacterium]